MSSASDPDQTRADALATELQRLRERYYAGEPEVDDATYDAREDELRAFLADRPQLAPADNPLEQVGAAPRGGRRAIRHARPMLSLAKVSPGDREDGVREFAARFPASRCGSRRSSTASRSRSSSRTRSCSTSRRAGTGPRGTTSPSRPRTSSRTSRARCPASPAAWRSAARR